MSYLPIGGVLTAEEREGLRRLHTRWFGTPAIRAINTITALEEALGDAVAVINNIMTEEQLDTTIPAINKAGRYVSRDASQVLNAIGRERIPCPCGLNCGEYIDGKV